MEVGGKLFQVEGTENRKDFLGAEREVYTSGLKDCDHSILGKGLQAHVWVSLHWTLTTAKGRLLVGYSLLQSELELCIRILCLL